MKRIGNKIPWYKPFRLSKRNADLEKLTERQFCEIFSLKEDKKLYEEMMYKKEQRIIDLENNLELIINELTSTVESNS